MLDADRILMCNVRSFEERIKLKAELLDTRAGEVVWSEDYDFVAADLGTVVTDLAGVLLDVLGAQASAAERERVNDLGTFSPEAYDLYLQANAAYEAMHWSREGAIDDLAEVERLLDEALRIDPGSLEAHNNLVARCHCMPSAWTPAVEAFGKYSGMSVRWAGHSSAMTAPLKRRHG